MKIKNKTTTFATTAQIGAELPPSNRRRLPLAIGFLLAAGGQGVYAANFDCSWANGAGGTWNTPANWASCNAVIPNNGADTFNATINLAGTYQVTLNTSATIGTLSLNAAGATLAHTAGTLTAANINIDSGTYTMAGGTIANAVIDGAGGVFQVTSNSTLNGATLNRGLNVGGPGSSAALVVTNGLTLDHAAGESLAIFNPQFQGTNSLFFNTGTLGSDTANGKTGLVTLNPGSNSSMNVFINNGQTLSVGSGITIKTGVMGANSSVSITGATNSTLNNAGTISSETAGRTLTVDPTNTNNTGTLAAKTGGILTVGGNWSNAGGTISLDNDVNSTVNLGGAFETADLGTFSRGVNGLNGRVNITGTLTNTGSTFLLNNTTGSFNLAGGTIIGGLIDSAPGSASQLNLTAGSTLNGVTLALNFNVGSASSAAALGVVNGLTLDHAAGESLAVFNPAFQGTNSLFFNTGTLGSDTANGKTGLVTLNPGSNSNLNVFINNGQTLSVGSGITIKTGVMGANSNVSITGATNSTLNNAGTISSETAGRTLTVDPTNTNNTGTLAAKTGGILTVGGNWSNAGGTISLDNDVNSTVNLGGAFDTADLGTFSRGVNGLNGRVNITGTLTNTGSTLLLNNTTGSFNLAGGTIIGGLIDSAPGSASQLNLTAGSTLNGVTLALNFNVGSASSAAALGVVNGLTLDHAAGESLALFNPAFQGTNSLLFNTGTLGSDTANGKTGLVTLNPGANSNLNVFINNGQTLSVGSGITIKTGVMGANSNVSITGATNSTLNNAGTISSETAGRTLTVDPTNTNNTGTLAAKTGGILTVGGNWSNAGGTISLDNDVNSTVNLGGAFETADLGTFSRGVNGLNGRVNITGTLTNTDSTFLLNNTTGSFNLAGGTIIGGLIDSAPGSASQLNLTANSTLNGVTLALNFNVGSASSAAALGVVNGLTLDHAAGESLAVFNPAFQGTNSLLFNTGTLGSDTANGKTGLVTLNPGANSNLNVFINNGQTLSVGSGITIKTGVMGANSNVSITGATNSTLNNAGTISSETAGRTLTVDPTNTNNTGTLAAKTGGILTVGGNWSNAGGTISLDNDVNSTVNLGGAFETADLGTFSRGVNGLNGRVNITGTLTNTGSTLLLNNTTGSFNLAGGTIIGGLIDSAPGSASQLNLTANSTLNGVTLALNFNVGSASSAAALGVVNGLTLDHAAGESLALFNPAFQGTNSLLFNTGTLGSDTANGKTGLVTLNPGANSNLNVFINNGQTLSVGSGITIKTGVMGANSNVSITGATNSTLNNAGTISSETAGRTLTVDPTNTNNTGTLAAKTGGILTMGGNWSNAGGTISLDNDVNSTVNLGGAFDTADLGTFSRGVNGLNGRVNITGTLTNTDSTFLLNNTTGSFNLAGGTIIGGLIDSAPGSASLLNVTAGSTLNGVKLALNLNVGSASSAAALGIVNGLTLNHAAGESLALFNPAFQGTNSLIFNTGTLGSDTANGETGLVTLNPGNNASLNVFINNGQTLTVGSGVTIRTGVTGAASNTSITGAATSTLLAGGTISSESAGHTLSLTPITLTNTGTFSAKNGGTLVVGRTNSAAGLTNLAGGTLTGGTYEAYAGSTVSFGTATFTVNAANILLDGVGSTFAAVNPLATNNGSFTIRNGRNFTTAGALLNNGLLGIGASSTLNVNGALTSNDRIELAGGILDATGTVTNNAAGQISGFGTLNDTVLNHGIVRASGGNLIATGGIDGQSGTIQVDSGATLTVGTSSDADFLVNNGTLALGTSNVTVAQDYTNGNFGVGNTFNARAGVTGAGQILAAGDIGQALTGEVTGAGPNYTMTFGNVHVGDSVTRNYQVANTGTTGPSLRGALQTTANGGNITDARLGGSGVTAANFGPLAAGANTGNLGVTFNATSAGALSGQVLKVANNFDNVADSLLSIVSSAAYRLANPTAHTPEPIAFGNLHVGDVANQVLSLTNNVPNDGFSEALNASIGNTTGAATSNGGSFNLLGAGATNNSSLSVGLNTAVAGARSGTAQITLASDGTGSSGLGITALAAQTVNVSGNVFRFADAGTLAPNPVAFGNRHVGDVTESFLSLTNGAANDGFSERLNASFGGTTGNATSNGSVSLLGAGATSANVLKVGINTATVGVKTGTATVNFVSDGAGTSGLGQTALNGANNTVNEQQVVNVSGTVFRLASASAHTPEPVVLANARVGGVSTQALTLTNTAAADGFSEALNASIGGAGAGLTATGSFSLLGAQASNNSSLIVGLDTASAGHKAGTASISLTSDGAGTSALGQTALSAQTVNISGDVFRLASASAHTPEPVVLANARVGGISSQALALTNNAAADGFSERLNASIGGATAGITANGAFSLLGAQATNNSSLSVALDTVSAGHKIGTATITLASDGTGTSGFTALGIGTQTVNVSGDVFRLATANTQQPIVFGNSHVGDVVTQTINVLNTAAADGFSESLNATIGGATGSATTNGGSINLLAAGAGNNSALSIGLDTATAGAKTGSANLALASDGTGTSGFGAFGIGAQTVNVSGAVYRLAQVNTLGGINFGNVHVGDILSQALAVQNLATADGFSESLNASFAGSSDARILTSGSINLLAAGGVDNSSMTVGLDTSAAGIVDGTVTLNFASDGTGTSGLGVTALASQVLDVDALITEAAVFRFASADILNAQPINFGKFRVGDVVSTVGLSIQNDVPNDGFSERLNGSAGGASAGFTVAGSFNLLGAGATDNGSIGVGMSTASAGHKSGTATVDFVSDGAGTSELGQTALPGQNVLLSGDVYRLAAASTAANVNVGNAHVGDVLSTTLSVSNSAAADGFSEALNATVTGDTGDVTAGGAFNLLTAGGTNNTGLTASLDTATVGAKIGTATVAFASDGTGTSGFSAIGLAGQQVTLSGAVFDYAQASLSAASLTLDARRVGDIAASRTLTVSNLAANDGFHEGLNASLGVTPAGYTASGNTLITNLAAGSSADATLTLATTTSGTFAGTVDVTLASNGTLSGLADTALPSQSVNVNGKVYAAAIADVQTTTVDFGIVHKNDVVGARNLTVQNDASGALTDVLTGSISAGGAFGANGTLGAGLAAGATDSSSLAVTLDTSSTGVFGGQAALAFASHNVDMVDLNLGTTLVDLSAQVNEYANPVFSKLGGAGSFTVQGSLFTVDFGSIEQGSLALSSQLQMANDVVGPADFLRVEVNGSSANFSLSGFLTMNLGAGETQSLSVGLNPVTLGSFDDLITFSLFGYNASGYDQFIGEFDLSLKGVVLPPSSVPVPPAVWLFGSAVVGLGAMRRRIRCAA